MFLRIACRVLCLRAPSFTQHPLENGNITSVDTIIPHVADMDKHSNAAYIPDQDYWKLVAEIIQRIILYVYIIVNITTLAAMTTVLYKGIQERE